jgi:hypothetical protein
MVVVPILMVVMPICKRVGPLTACEGPHQPASEEAKIELKMCALIVCRFVAEVSRNVYRNNPSSKSTN